MSKTVDDIIFDFLNDGVSGRSGNVSYDHDVLYSYAMPIAWRHPNGAIAKVHPEASCSVTTSRHISSIRGGHVYTLPSPRILEHLQLKPRHFTAHMSHSKTGLSRYTLLDLSRAVGKRLTYLYRAPMHLLAVPHYHHLICDNQPDVYFRSDADQILYEGEKLWQLMLRNPPGRRFQRRLAKAFTEDRLAQIGVALIEKLPKRDARKTSSLHTSSHHGVLQQTFTLTNGVPNSPLDFSGTINRRRVAPKEVVCRLYPQVAPLIYANNPMSLWDVPAVHPRELK